MEYNKNGSYTPKTIKNGLFPEIPNLVKKYKIIGNLQWKARTRDLRYLFFVLPLTRWISLKEKSCEISDG